MYFFFYISGKDFVTRIHIDRTQWYTSTPSPAGPLRLCTAALDPAIIFLALLARPPMIPEVSTVRGRPIPSGSDMGGGQTTAALGPVIIPIVKCTATEKMALRSIPSMLDRTTLLSSTLQAPERTLPKVLAPRPNLDLRRTASGRGTDTDQPIIPRVRLFKC